MKIKENNFCDGFPDHWFWVEKTEFEIWRNQVPIYLWEDGEIKHAKP